MINEDPYKNFVAGLPKEVDEWRYKNGYNTFPAISIEKTPILGLFWKNGGINFQTNPIPETEHLNWKRENKFKDGYAVIVGPLWFGEDTGKYGLCLDFDKWKAIVAFFGGRTIEETWNNVKRFAQTNRVDYREHEEEHFKLHVFINTTRLFKDGSGGKRNRHLLIGLEVRVERELVYCGQRKGRKFYRPLGTRNISTWNEDQLQQLEEKIDELDVEKDHLTTAEEREDPNFYRDENQNRSLPLLQHMGTILRKYLAKKKKRSLDELTEIELQEAKLEVMKWYQEHEKEYPGSKFDENWKQELVYIKNCIAEEIRQEQEREEWVNETYQRYKQEQQKQTPSEVSLDAQIDNKDYVKYVVDTANRTVKQEDVLVRQILYAGLSAYSEDPLNLGILAPTSEGKTYPITEVMKLFPQDDVWYIGDMSTKVLVRLKGILVDRRNEPLSHIVKRFKHEIALLGNGKKDRIKKVELQEKLEEILEGSKNMIHLDGKILVFLEPPDPELWALLKPILSHDTHEIEYPFVDTSNGVTAKHIVVSGWPSCLVCSARDESKWEQWDEIVSRFMIVSPNMVAQKYKESNILIFQKRGLPSVVTQKLVISDEQRRIAQQCIEYIKSQIKVFNKAWLPFGDIIAHWLPAEKGTDSRSAKRINSLLNIIPLLRSNLRYKLQYSTETLVIASIEDLKEVLELTKDLTGIPPHKLKFFNEYILSLYKEVNHALTGNEICINYKNKTRRSMNNSNLRKRYIAEFLEAGMLEEEFSKEDKRMKVYTPLIDEVASPGTDVGLDPLSHIFSTSADVSANFERENWLKQAISEIKKCGTGNHSFLTPIFSQPITEEKFISDYLSLTSQRSSNQAPLAKRSSEIGDSLPVPDLSQNSHQQTIQVNKGFNEVLPLLEHSTGFDCEWNDNGVYCACFYPNGKPPITLHIKDFGDYSRLGDEIISTMEQFSLVIGHNISGKESDFNKLYKICDTSRLNNIQYIDTLRLFKMKLVDNMLKATGIDYPSCSLNDIAKAYINESKLDNLTGLDIEKLPPEKQLEYCLKDAELALKIVRKDNWNILQVLYSIKDKVGMTFLSICNAYSAALGEGMLSVNGYSTEMVPAKYTNEKIPYEGAIVLEPQKGIHRNITTLDAKSMYPTIVAKWNLSSETVNCQCCKDISEAKFPLKIMHMINDGLMAKKQEPILEHWWRCLKHEGIYTRIERQLIEEKNQYEKECNEVFEKGRKLLANSTYGMFQFMNYKYVDQRLGFLITAFGRMIIQGLANECERFGFTVIYGDTDSLFLQPTDNTPHLQEFIDLAQSKYKANLDIDKEWDILLIKAKKSYFGITKSGKFVSKKMHGMKSNNTPLQHELMSKVVNKQILELYKENKELAQQKIISDVNSILNRVSDKQEFKFKASKDLSEYGNGFEHEVYLERTEKGLPVNKGERYSYYKIVPVKIDDRIKKFTSLYPEKYDIDVKKQEVGLLNCVKDIVSAFGISMEELIQH